jgi:LAO/AO transport system kinase
MRLVDGVLAGDRRALARLATHVENDSDIGRAGLAALYPHSGQAHVIGLTGPPGAGKSSLLNRLIATFRDRNRSVAVVAIDPSSPLSGGATLGDRIRMLERQQDPDVFIRSMASRGRSGGLAPATAGVVHLLDAAGFDLVVVETVGVGQEQIDVSHLVDTLTLVQTPGTGDGVQLLKAGLMEFADIFAVNKADQPGAADLLRGLRSMLHYSMGPDGEWSPAIVRCSAKTGEGIVELADQIEAHLAFLRKSGQREQRRRQIARAEIADQVNAAIRRKLDNQSTGHDQTEHLIEQVAQRHLAPHQAVECLFSLLNLGD